MPEGTVADIHIYMGMPFMSVNFINKTLRFSGGFLCVGFACVGPGLVGLVRLGLVRVGLFWVGQCVLADPLS